MSKVSVYWGRTPYAALMVGVVIALLGAFALSLAAPAPAQAATIKPNKSETVKVSHTSLKYYLVPTNQLYINGKKKFKNVKNSNTKVAKVEVTQDGKALNITTKKPGKTKITYKYGGKTYKKKLVVVKYANPVKSFKIGKKNYVSKFKKYGWFACSHDVSGLVSVKAKRGWTLKKIVITNIDDYSTKKVANNKYTMTGGYNISAFLKNKKTGLVQEAAITVDAV